MFFSTGVDLQNALSALPASKKGSYVAFDSFFYSQQYMSGGLYSGSLSPIEHFVQIGAARGNKSNATFDPVFYKAKYPADLANSGFDAADLIYHFMRFGLDEGRIPNATFNTFDAAGYLNKYPDVGAFVNSNLALFNGSASNGAIAHYVKFGAFQGFSPVFTIPPVSTEGTAFTLTTGNDSIPGLTGSNGATSTANGDTISALIDANSTLNNGDSINAGAGVDTMNIRVVATPANGPAVAPSISNLEKIFIKNESTADGFQLSFSNISGVTEVWSKDSAEASRTLASGVDPTVTVGMQDTAGSAFGVNFKGDRTGSSDAFTLALSGAGTENLPTVFVLTDPTGNATDSSFEIANIVSKTKSSLIFLDQASLKTINVTGDAFLSLAESNSSFSELSKVDASQMTSGGIKIRALGSVESGFQFIGSGSDDTVQLKNGTINTASLLAGGGGKDTLASLNFNNLSTAAVNAATGFEVLQGLNGVENFTASVLTSINEFLFTGNAASNNGFTIEGIEDNDGIALSTDIISGGNFALRLSGKNAGTTANLELRSISNFSGEVVLTATSNNNPRFGIELVSGINKLVIDSTGTSSKANVIETSKQNDSGFAISNVGTSLFSVTGSHDLSIMAKVGVDISNGQRLDGFTKAANVDASNFSGVLRIAGSGSADVINGGSGADIIYGQNGADILTGNGGADQFRLSGFDNSTDLIKDFIKGVDKIGLSFNFSNTRGSQAGATLESTDYVSNRDGITAIGNSDAGKIIELQKGLSGSQIATDSASAAVEAWILVFNTDTQKAELWHDDNWSNATNRDHVVTFENIVNLAGVQGFVATDFVEFIY
jgi:hypothetical protein